MHSEHVNVAIGAAMQGGKVAVYSETLEKAKALADRFEGAVPVALAVERVSRVNGRFRLDFLGGGSIRFISLRQSSRGLSLDRVFVPVGTDPDKLADIVPALCTSADGELTEY